MDFSLLFIGGLNGLAYGALLFSVVSGLTVIFGVLRILNFAHGCFCMVGAYAVFQIVFSFNNFWIAPVLAPLAVAGIGVIIEFFLLRQAYRLGITYQLLVTFVLGLIIADVVKIVWGVYFRSLAGPGGVMAGFNRFTTFGLGPDILTGQ